MILTAAFTICALAAFVGLCLTDPRAVPPVTGTCALILTAAALAVAITR